MTTPLEVMKQALDFAERTCGDRCNTEYNPCEARELADALRAAITEAEKCEPDAVVSIYPVKETGGCRIEVDAFWLPEGRYNLFTHPTPKPAIPEGWQLVPKKVTDEMTQALIAKRFGMHDVQGMWDDLLAAAPKEAVS